MKDTIAILAAAAFVIAVLFVLFNMRATSTPTTAVHHGGAHGRAGILFKQHLSGPMRATSRASPARLLRARELLQTVGGGIVASTAITGEQISGPMTLEKQRLARHDSGATPPQP